MILNRELGPTVGILRLFYFIYLLSRPSEPSESHQSAYSEVLAKQRQTRQSAEEVTHSKAINIHVHASSPSSRLPRL